MYVKIEMDYRTLKNNSWSGALDTLKDIEEADKEDELMYFLEEIFNGEIPTETEVNDFLWFERDYIYESLGLDENGRLID
jgi:hypothetical protein